MTAPGGRFGSRTKATAGDDRRPQTRRRRAGTWLLHALALTACHAPRPDERAAGNDGGTAARGEPAASIDAEPRADPIAAPSPALEAMAPSSAWATWPMPNAPSSGLPNSQSYDTSTAGVVVDRVTSLMWQRRIDRDTATFDEARARCARLVLAGYDDWRLPSRIELASIVDLSRTLPSLDPKAFPQTPNDWFWTASIATTPGEAWYVYFYFGYPKSDQTSNRFSYRCVRSPRPAPTSPSARYDISAATVHDAGTGLVWQRRPAPRKLQYDGARAYCAHLDLSGHRDWRLPSMLELLTLVDERTSNPSIDASAFPETPSESFWTASTFADSAAMAWHVYFDYGNALYGLLNGAYRVRCVR